MPGQDDIQRRIQARIGQGEFLAGLLHVAARQSGAVQEQFVAQLSRIATAMRELMGANDLIRRLPYRPGEFWPGLRGQAIAFVDAGVANMELPSAAPIGIRVGSYIVRPGEATETREQFDIQLSLVDDLYSDQGVLYDDDFLDIAKLRDAARIASETAVALKIASETNRPDAIVLHGPLINPVSPYGLDDFPAYGIHACQTMLGEPDWQPEEDPTDRKFVALHLELLKRLRETGTPVVGAVERSLGKEPVVTNRILDRLQDSGSLRERDAKRLLDDLRSYGLNDASLFDVVLQEGEYVTPIPVMRQGPENKWPDVWKRWIRSYPNALTTYLKPSEMVMPFRVEAFEDIGGFEPMLDLILHTSRLLPSYGFPVGLDIVDKFAKVPSWMSRGVMGQHRIVLLQKAIASGDPRALAFAKRVLAARGRDWLFRPTA
jgi:hypothetical protein